MSIFRLSETYEFYIDPVEYSKLVRIEMFKLIDAPQTFRVRVWLQSTYDLYPTFINFEKDSYNQVISSDQFNQEITLSVAPSPDWLTGVEVEDEKAFFNEIYLSVCKFLR